MREAWKRLNAGISKKNGSSRRPAKKVMPETGSVVSVGAFAFESVDDPGVVSAKNGLHSSFSLG